VSDHVSHPYKTKDKITVLYILIFIFLDGKLEDKRYPVLSSGGHYWSFLDENLIHLSVIHSTAVKHV